VAMPIILPWPLQSSLEAATQALFDRGDQSSVDFLRPNVRRPRQQFRRCRTTAKPERMHRTGGQPHRAEQATQPSKPDTAMRIFHLTSAPMAQAT
jgi:hypothetical protein